MSPRMVCMQRLWDPLWALCGPIRDTLPPLPRKTLSGIASKKGYRMHLSLLSCSVVRWRSPISGFLRCSADIFGVCQNLRFSAKVLCPPKTWISKRRGGCAKTCGRSAFWDVVCHLFPTPQALGIRLPLTGAKIPKIGKRAFLSRKKKKNISSTPENGILNQKIPISTQGNISESVSTGVWCVQGFDAGFEIALEPSELQKEGENPGKGHFYFLCQTLVCTKPWFKRDLKYKTFSPKRGLFYAVKGASPPTPPTPEFRPPPSLGRSSPAPGIFSARPLLSGTF